MNLLHIIYRANNHTESTPNLSIYSTMKLNKNTHCLSMRTPTQNKCEYPVTVIPILKSLLTLLTFFLIKHPLFSIGYMFDKKTENILWLKTNFINLCRYSYITNFVKKNNIDHINIFFGDSGEVFAELKKVIDIKLSISFHGCDSGIPFLKRCKALKKYCDAYFVLCEFMKNDLLSVGIDESKIYVVYTGFDFSILPLESDVERENQVLYVGRLVDKKGILDGINAFAKIADKHPLYDFVIVGDGYLREPADTLIKKLGLTQRIKLEGHQPPTSVYQYMKKAKVFLLPSKVPENGSREGTPCVILEAQALGLPIVSTYHAGIPEIVLEGKTALLSEEGNINGMAESLDRLLSDNQMIENFSKEASEYSISNYPIMKRGEKLLEIYKELKSI